jgi:hypothetical protein
MMQPILNEIATAVVSHSTQIPNGLLQNKFRIETDQIVYTVRTQEEEELTEVKAKMSLCLIKHMP